MTLFVMRPASISQASPQLTAATHNASVAGAVAISSLAVEQTRRMASAATNATMSGVMYSTSTYSSITNDSNNNNTSSRSQASNSTGEKAYKGAYIPMLHLINSLFTFFLQKLYRSLAW